MGLGLENGPTWVSPRGTAPSLPPRGPGQPMQLGKPCEAPSIAAVWVASPKVPPMQCTYWSCTC